MRAIRRWTAGSAACIQAVLACAIGCFAGTAHAEAAPPGYSAEFMASLRHNAPEGVRACIEQRVLERWPTQAELYAAANAVRWMRDPAEAVRFAIREVLASCEAEPDWFTPATIRASDLPADAPRFEQFAVAERFAGKPAAPDVRSHPRSRMFRTMIRAGARQGPNFAGHYTLVHWGCGSGCSAYAIVDARTGRVFHPANFASIAIYNIDDALTASDERFVRFSLDSRLLVVIGGINEDPALRGISYFVWEGERLRRIRFVPRPDLPDATK